MAQHIMLDLETMSTASNAAIISIGAVKFSINDGIKDTFYINVSLESSMAQGLSVDAQSMMWWIKQSKEAREKLSESPMDLTYALDAFTSWIDGEKYMMWGNGATFDNVILSNAYKAVGFKQPWSYRNDSCYRTMKNMFDAPFLLREPLTPHNALDDAKYQALHLIAIFKKLGIK